MRSHNKIISELLDAHLPKQYTAEAIDRLEKKGIIVNAEIVRNARQARKCQNFSQIVAVLVEMAREEQKAKKDLNDLISKSI